MSSLLSVVSTLLVLFLVLLMAWGLSRFLGVWLGPGRSGGNIRILEQVPVGQNQKLMLVRIRGEKHCMLIGVGAEGFTLLRELPEDWEECPEGPELLPEESFRRQLKSCLGRLPDKGAVGRIRQALVKGGESSCTEAGGEGKEPEGE